MTIEQLDNRMFQLLEELKSRGVLKYKRAFCAACGLPEQNLSNIKNGVNHFNLIHVANICEYYNLDANWILRGSEDLFLRKPITKRKQIA
jgi:hypothetical protein